MLKKIKLFEDYNTSVFKAKNMVFTLYVKESEPTEVYLILDDDLYDYLSVIVPDSSNLEQGEFFLNPDIDDEIVNILIDQNFISETSKETIAGDKKTKSYILV